MTAPADRPYDIVVFGATSFVGEILCRYVTERHGTDADLRWAIAGRNEQKLEAVAATTGADVRESSSTPKIGRRWPSSLTRAGSSSRPWAHARCTDHH